MSDFSGSYSKNRLLQVLDEIKSESSPEFDSSIMVSSYQDDVAVHLLFYLNSEVISLVSNSEQISLEDIIKKSKTL